MYLQDHGVEKIYHLESDTLETECPGLIYICRPKLKYMRYIASKFFFKTNKKKHSALIEKDRSYQTLFQDNKDRLLVVFCA